MYFSLPSIVSGLALLATSVYATPVPAPAPVEESAGLEKRTSGGVYTCTAINYTGTCKYQVYTLNTCYPFTGGYEYTISSFGPDANTLCQVYYDHNCQDSGSITQQLNGVFIYPGAPDLRTVNWNDAIGSMKCQWFER